MDEKYALKTIGIILACITMIMALDGCKKNESIMAESTTAMSPKEMSDAEAYSSSIDENQKTYKKCVGNILGLNTEGVSVYSYYEGDNLVKLEIAYYGETGKFEESEYLKNSEMILIKDLETSYNIPIYEEGPYVKSETQSTIYFKNQKMVALAKGGVFIKSDSEEFLAREKQWADEIGELKIKKLISEKPCN